MKTEVFTARLLGATQTTVCNHNMNPIGFIHYNKPEQEQPKEHVQQKTNNLLSGPAVDALLDAFREWLEFESTHYTSGGFGSFGCQNDHTLKKKIEAVRELYPKRR